MLTIRVNEPHDDRTIITSLGSVTLSESLSRDVYNVYSQPEITVTGLVISGSIDTLNLELYPAAPFAENTITFCVMPSVSGIIAIDDREYTFIPNGATYSGVDQVELGTNVFTTAQNFYRVFNAEGISGTDFYAGQTAHTTVNALAADNPIYLRAKTAGIAGNAITTTTTIPTAIAISFGTMFNGAAASGKNVLIQTLPWVGNGDYTFNKVSYEPTGKPYYAKVWLTEENTVAVNASGIAQYYETAVDCFYGSSTIAHYAEVPMISGMSDPAGGMSSSGEFYVTWEAPNIYASGTVFPTAYPGAAGAQSQTSLTLSAECLAQQLEYVVFVYVGATSPQCAWPRKTDGNGTWYYAGRTKKTRAHIHTSLPNTTGVWVGFGNKDTLASATVPFKNTNSSVYLL